MGLPLVYLPVCFHFWHTLMLYVTVRQGLYCGKLNKSNAANLKLSDSLGIFMPNWAGPYQTSQLYHGNADNTRHFP